MGSFFTNVHVRGADPARLRAFIEARLAEEGYELAEGPADRELIVVPSGGWTALYDARAEGQDETIGRWAKHVSAALETHAISVLVHDSDVLALALYAFGKRRDAYDSNPAFSGKSPSKVTPVARARKWAEVTLPGHDLALAFAQKHVLAEAALAIVGPAIGADPDLLATGHRYLTSEGPVPANAIRIHARYRTRPAWHQRMTGAPRIISEWTRHGREAPATRPQPAEQGELVRAFARATNAGGPGRGLRVEIEASGDSVEPRRVEIVVTKTGHLQMDRYSAALVREGTQRYVAVMPEVVLQPGFDGEPEDIIGAPMTEMLDAHNAGLIHVNLTGTALRAGTTKLAIALAPLEGGDPHVEHVEHVEHVVVDVR